MKVSLNATLNKLIWLLTIFLFVSFLIFETYSWGRYAFLGVSALVIILSSIIYGGKIRVRLCPYYCFLGLFAVYVGIASIWAWNSAAAISKAVTLVQILGCSAMLYVHYDRQDNVRELLSAVKWAGFIVAVYAIFFYGIENLGLEEGVRLDNEFANINGIGMAAALSCVLQAHEFLNKRSRWPALMMLPAVIMIAATQSRKALVFLMVGALGVYVLHSLTQKSISKRLWRTILSVAVICLAFYFVLQLPIFEGIMSRMETMVAPVTGQGEMDSSAVSRSKMVELGWEYFLKYPVGGYGFGSSAVITQRNLGWSTYLHNNYVEVLSGGGVIGFVLYYAVHIYMFVNLIKYRKADQEAFCIGFVWLVLILIMDWGSVSYIEKSRWYYLMILCLNISCMQKKGRLALDEHKKTA